MSVLCVVLYVLDDSVPTSNVTLSFVYYINSLLLYWGATWIGCVTKIFIIIIYANFGNFPGELCIVYMCFLLYCLIFLYTPPVNDSDK